MRDRVGHRLVVFIATAAILAGQVLAGPLDETRYCQITPNRDKDGSITRRADVLAAFKRHHPCPSTGKTSGRCPGWAIDHVIPLANGGCDSVHNLQWLPHELKSCAKTCKDRWERKVYRLVQ